MDLTALQTALRERLGIPTTDAFFASGNLTSLLNAALHYIETEFDWPWLETNESIPTVNAQQAYTTAAGAMRTVTVRNATSGVLLRELPLEELDFWGTPAGSPRAFARQASSLLLVPVPTGVESLTHRYVRSEPDLASGTDTPLMPASFHQSIVEYAAYLSFRRDSNVGEAGAALAAYNDWREQMMRRANRWADTDGGGARQAPEAAKAAP